MFSSNEIIKKLDFGDMEFRNVTNMEAMFSSCKNLREVNIRNIKAGKLKYMQDMFIGCNRLNSVYFGDIDIHSVKDLSQLFFCCNTIEEIDLRNFNFRTLESANIDRIIDETTRLKRIILKEDYVTPELLSKIPVNIIEYV